MYERFFGLGDLPFRLTPDPRYLFLSSRHADALAHLELGLTESSGFVCITGDVGTGKTTLLRHFLSDLGDDVHTAYVFNPALTPLELLQTINIEFGLPATTTSKTELIAALNARLLAEHAEDKRSIVVIDEAQALDLAVLEQLRLLSNLETTTQKLLRIILVGQPQLRDLLGHPDLTQLNQRITLRWHIGPLGRRETAAYVRHRIGVAADEKGRRIFTRGALRRIHRLSGGVPRLINMIAHRALIAGFAADRTQVGRRIVDRVHRELSAVPLPHRRHRTWPRVAGALGAGVAVGAIAVLAGRSWLVESSATPAAPVGTIATLVPVAPLTAPPGLDPVAAIASLDAGDSARLAFRVVASAWEVDPPPVGIATRPSDFGTLARNRSVEHVTLKANASMLRLLDVPAILELHFPDGAGLRAATLVGVSDDEFILDVGGQEMTVDLAFFEQYWFGNAHLFWRDSERLGRTSLGRGSVAAEVERLQATLAALGLYTGTRSGIFERETEAAVRAFQRDRFLTPDGVVGPLTKLALHSAAASYRPSLAATGGLSIP